MALSNETTVKGMVGGGGKYTTAKKPARQKNETFSSFSPFASKWENLNNRKKEGTGSEKRKKLMAKCARVVK